MGRGLVCGPVPPHRERAGPSPVAFLLEARKSPPVRGGRAERRENDDQRAAHFHDGVDRHFATRCGGSLRHSLDRQPSPPFSTPGLPREPWGFSVGLLPVLLAQVAEPVLEGDVAPPQGEVVVEPGQDLEEEKEAEEGEAEGVLHAFESSRSPRGERGGTERPGWPPPGPPGREGPR